MSLSGPCLCGDPYCSFCGNPEAAAFADEVDQLLEEISDAIETEEDLIQFQTFFKCWKTLFRSEDKLEKEEE